MNALHVIVSGVRTQTHAVYLASWLRHRLDGFDGPISVVDLDAGRSGALPLRTVESLLPSSDQLEILATLPDRVAANVYVAIGAPGIKPWLRLRCRRSFAPFHTVAVDEGIGSYGDRRTRRAAMAREGVPEPWATVRSAAVAWSDLRLTDERWRLYEHNHTGWAINERIRDEFRRCHGELSRSDDVVFLTQPWVDLGLIDLDRYLRHIEGVRAAVEAAGRSLRVRPHPREPVGRYASFDVLDRRCPAELDPDVVAAGFVVGETSSALVNVAAIFSVPARAVRSALADELRSQLSARQRSLFETFLDPPVDAAALTDVLTSSDG